MRHIVFRVHSSTATVRKENRDGREYLVAPVVAIVEGVLNQWLVTAEEIDMSAAYWEGVPLTVNHPQDDYGAASIHSGDLLLKVAIGSFENTAYNEALRALTGELWIDVELAMNSGDEGVQIVETVNAGLPLEVSTGYFAEYELQAGEWNGETYREVHHALSPDHLALLPNTIGACSWSDGCGAPRLNQENRMRTNARRPSFVGTEDTEWGGCSFAAYADGFYRHTGKTPDPAITTHEQATPEMKRWIAAKSLLGDERSEDLEGLISLQVVNPATNKLARGALKVVANLQEGIPEEALKSAQAMAARLLKQLYRNHDGLTANGAKLGTVLTKMVADQTGTLSKADLISKMAASAGISEDKVKQVLKGEVDFPPRKWLQGFALALDVDVVDMLLAADVDTIPYRRPDAVANAQSCGCQENQMKKDARVAALIANKRTRFEEKDRAWLSTLEDAQLEKFEPADEAAPKTPEEIAQEAIVANEAKKARETRVNALVLTKNHSEADREFLATLNEAQLTALEAKTTPKEAREEKPKQNAQTPEQYLAGMPEELREVFANGLKREQQTRATLLKALKENTECELEPSELDGMKTATLERLARSFAIENYAGAAGGNSSAEDDDAAPPMPAVFTRKTAAA